METEEGLINLKKKEQLQQQRTEGTETKHPDSTLNFQQNNWVHKVRTTLETTFKKVQSERGYISTSRNKSLPRPTQPISTKSKQWKNHILQKLDYELIY